MLKKQKAQKIFDDHQKAKNALNNTNPSNTNEFGQFLTDEEIAQFGSFSSSIHPSLHFVTFSHYKTCTKHHKKKDNYKPWRRWKMHQILIQIQSQQLVLDELEKI